MNFAQELKKLNKEQREAVETIEGPVMVVAGPGTGKTQVLTLRIANILKKTDTPPESVLALTFTESAAASMRKRLYEIMGQEAYRVSIKTIHGFCNEVIQNYPEEFKELSGATNISEVDQIQLIRKLLDSGDYDLLRSFGDPYRNAKDIARAISTLKQEGKTPKDFEAIIKKEQPTFAGKKITATYQTEVRRIARHKELAKLYAAYQRALRKSFLYDYDDMIIEVARTLETNSSLRFTLQEQYLYILVDEHQDTNQGQNKVIELLASFHESPNLFVVGDEKQAIYRFQGASVENFSYFRKRFKGAKIINLAHSYRSHQTILDAAFDLALGKGPLKAQAKHPKQKIKLAALSRPDVEQYFIASDIQRKLKSGVKPEQIAVLYRVNKDSAPLARMLEKLGVPYAVESDEDVLSDLDIKKLLLLFEAVREFGQDYALIPALYIDFLDIAPLDIVLLLDAARKARSSVFVIARDQKVLEKIVPKSAEKIFKLYQNLSVWKARSKNENPLAVFESIVRESGFIAAILKDSSGVEKLAKLHALFDELKSLVERKPETMLDDFLDHVDIIREHRVSIRSSTVNGQPSAVRLMTAHKAKGQEFEYVYITGAVHKHWGSRQRRDLIKLPEQVYSEADERNVFYVALTRAKKDVTITYSQKNADGREQLVSEFVGSVRSELIEKIDTSNVETEFKKHRDIEFRAPVLRTPDLKEKKFLQQRFLDKGLSVSALNNYLKCPLRFYFVNLIGIPEAQHPTAQIGSAAHDVLNFVFQRLNADEPLSKRQFLDRFAYLLSKMPMREVDYREGLKKGERVLSAYYDFYSKGWLKNSKPEYAINDVKVGKIKLRGRIDRIDFPTASPVRGRSSETTVSSNGVHVVDYKFKKPVSLSDDYRRQLTFYKLLLERGTKWKMRDAEIDFLEQDSRGKFKRQVFAPSEADVRELETLIKKVSTEILDLQFFDNPCNKPDCEYCALRAVMKGVS